MGTTKRTAKKAVISSKKKTAPKKPAAKKAVTRKTPKKVTKKATVKKTTPKKTSTKATKSVPQSKLLKPKKKETLFNSPKEKKDSYALPRTVALSLFVLPKMPVDIDTLAIGLARYGGIGVVILGALLTYFHASALDLVPGKQYAAALSLTSNTEQQLLEGEQANTGVIPKPEVSFDFDQAGYFKKSVKVHITVATAKRVDVVAHRIDASQRFTLGTAKRVSDGVWEFVWDTAKYENGFYKVEAIVITEETSFAKTSDKYEIKNQVAVPVTDNLIKNEEPVEQPDTTTNTSLIDATTVTETENESEATESEASETDATAVADQTEEFNLTLDFERQENSVQLRAKSSSATSRVTFSIANDRGDITSLGAGEKISPTNFSLTYKTTDLAPGQYYLFADTVVNDVSYQTKKRSFLINESQQDVGATKVEEFNEQPISVNAETATTENTQTKLPLSVSIKPVNGERLSGIAPFVIQTNRELQKIEVYMRRENTLSASYVGVANRAEGQTWRIAVDTNNLPNGNYTIFTRTWLENVSYFGQDALVRIANPEVEKPLVSTETKKEAVSPVTEASTKTFESDNQISAELNRLKNASTTSGEIESRPQILTAPASRQRFVDEAITKSEIITRADVPEAIEASETDSEKADQQLTALLARYQARLDESFKRLAIAIRGKDSTAIGEIQEQLNLLETDIVRSALSEADTDQLVSLIENRLRRQLAEMTLRTEQTERIVRERVGDEALVDTDNDGVTDYDERNIYQTDPLMADSDNDGFIDGIEILNGYDPTSAESEVVVAYESPKTTGALRPDVFEITAITSVKSEKGDNAPDAKPLPTAVISGRGLPNSFVTLFVYSNPVVVTIKTDKDGNWSYTFDKEIEDGEHEVYVGVTDNAGRVVAKSEPTRFIKTAEAFTPVDADTELAVVGQTERQSLVSPNILLLVGSLSIVSIGVILILLGLHLRTREKKFAVTRVAELTQVV